MAFKSHCYDRKGRLADAGYGFRWDWIGLDWVKKGFMLLRTLIFPLFLCSYFVLRFSP